MTTHGTGALLRLWTKLPYLWRYQVIFWGVYLVGLFPVHFIGLRYVYQWQASLSSIIILRVTGTLIMILMTRVFAWTLESRLFRRLGIPGAILWICAGSLVLLLADTYGKVVLMRPIYENLGQFQSPSITPGEARIAHYSYTFLLYAAWAVIFVFSRRASEAKLREAELREAEAKRREAEILMLRSQLNPHFLFNALKALSEDAGNNPNARHLIGGISDYLRYSLANRHQLFVPMSEEIRATKRYIEVEISRFGDGLTYKIDADPECLGIPVPGILLQPLAEKAIQRGRSGNGSLHLDLRCRYSDNLLRIILSSNSPWIPEHRLSGGTGIATLHERLELLYPGRAKMTVSTEADRTTVEISIRDPFLSAHDQPSHLLTSGKK